MLVRQTITAGKIANVEQARIYREVRELQTSVEALGDLFVRTDLGDDTGLRDLSNLRRGTVVVVDEKNPLAEKGQEHYNLTGVAHIGSGDELQDLAVTIGDTWKSYRYTHSNGLKTYLKNEGRPDQFKVTADGDGNLEIEKGLPDEPRHEPKASGTVQVTVKPGRVDTVQEGKALKLAEWLQGAVEAVSDDFKRLDATPETWHLDSADMNAEEGKVVLLQADCPGASKKIWSGDRPAWSHVSGELDYDAATGSIRSLNATLEGPQYRGIYGCSPLADGGYRYERNDSDGGGLQVNMENSEQWLVASRSPGQK